VGFSSPPEVVAGFNRAWAVGDLDAAMACVASDGVFRLRLPGDMTAQGREAIAAALEGSREGFEPILYRPFSLVTAGDIVRFQVEFMYRHRASGEVLSGRLRMVMRVEDGAIVRADEFHDHAKVQAFLRLAATMSGACAG
jgi:ketosteroid isomerase-like protein